MSPFIFHLIYSIDHTIKIVLLPQFIYEEGKVLRSNIPKITKLESKYSFKAEPSSHLFVYYSEPAKRLSPIACLKKCLFSTPHTS